MAATSVLSPELLRYATLDQEMVDITSSIRILSNLSWPSQTQVDFLQAWERGQRKLPEITYAKFDYSDTLQRLDQFTSSLDQSHPLGHYLYETAMSYWHACQMFSHIGTAQMTYHSRAIYGSPRDSLPGTTFTSLDAAQHFIQAANQFDSHVDDEEAEYCITASAMRDALQTDIDNFFVHHKIPVIIDENLASKATAGSSRIRIRGGTCYSQFDHGQLLQHEAFIHTLTGINGAQQLNLKSLGKGAPRTTATQEGLATFAEMVTGVMEITRLKRIALRIVAIDNALEGADFIDVFQFFLEQGQSHMESFSSAMRIFRGGDVRGSVAFTKDTVYLHGLLTAHAFFRWAMKEKKYDYYLRHPFAGRLTFDDVILLEPFFANGFVVEPTYVPPWAQNGSGLSAYLAFALFAENMKVHSLTFNAFGPRRHTA